MAIESIICNQKNQNQSIIVATGMNSSCTLAAKAAENAIDNHVIHNENNNVTRKSLDNMARSIGSSILAENFEFSGNTISIRNQSFQYDETIANLLGIGSFGAVFCGTDLRLNYKPSSSKSDKLEERRKVAIKKVARVNLKPHELRAMKRVRHPNLVRLIDVCDADSENENEKISSNFDTFTYLIMEMCDNDLDKHLKYYAENGCLIEDNLRSLFESIACGYFALNKKQIVHRDIKPQNILINYYKNNNQNNNCYKILTAKITDFGISRVLDTSDDLNDSLDANNENTKVLNNVAGKKNFIKKKQKSLGTFFYMAPEVGANILRISEYNHAADMWSIGCVFYQCLFGKIPFNESMLCKLFLYSACKNYEAYDPPYFSEDNKTEEWKTIVLLLLQIDPSSRSTPSELYNQIMSKAKNTNANFH